jgi:hypothetical protein
VRRSLNGRQREPRVAARLNSRTALFVRSIRQPGAASHWTRIDRAKAMRGQDGGHRAAVFVCGAGLSSQGGLNKTAPNMRTGRSLEGGYLGTGVRRPFLGGSIGGGAAWFARIFLSIARRFAFFLA